VGSNNERLDLRVDEDNSYRKIRRVLLRLLWIEREHHNATKTILNTLFFIMEEHKICVE
jgi:hypothetical protein